MSLYAVTDHNGVEAMRLAIITKYHGPTDTRGSRISALGRVAYESAGVRRPALRVTDGYACEQDREQNHCRVAKLLVAKFGWSGLYVAGGLPTMDGNVYVRVEGGNPLTVGGIDGQDWFYVAPK